MHEPTTPTGHLAPATSRLYHALCRLDAPTRARLTNRELAALAGVSTRWPRSVNTALAELVEAGLLEIVRVDPHPTLHPSGRLLNLTGLQPRPQHHPQDTPHRQ